MHYIYLYLLTIPVFFIIDMLWITSFASRFYQTQLAAFLGPVNWVAAGIFYALYIAGILLFAVYPALQDGSGIKALVLGLLLGLLAYATYDLTNLATVKDWPLIVTIVDMIWGMILTGTIAFIAFHIGRYLGL